jgi:UrcA family protein
MTIKTATAMALGLLVAFSSPAAAKDVTVRGQLPDQDQLTEIVNYSDLYLASDAGVNRLNLRVRNAVNRVCAPLDQRHTFYAFNDCREVARSGAQPQVDLAIARARQLASTGVSAIAPVAIVISAPAN